MMTQQKTMFAVKRTKTGLGLFATKLIPKGKRIIEYTGPLISNEEVGKSYGRYFFGISKKWSIDGSPRSNVARYINHSCQPNAYMKTLHGHMLFFALRDIRAGEEITVDYQVTLHPDTKRCRCRAANCRGTINRV